MISTILFILWFCLVAIPLVMQENENPHYWAPWALLSLLWIVPIFTGVPIENNRGEYSGYVTAVEQNGAIFKGWNAYLKTELESSDADLACIDREDQELIDRLKTAARDKSRVTIQYRGVMQFPIGECPGGDWMIESVK